jgi:broad specificity phosphatase PhoE
VTDDTGPTRPPGEWAELTAVRHGQSVANAAFATAEAAGHNRAEVTGPDAQVGLSELGRRQAAELGRWWAAQPADRLPEVALCSPFLRARQTFDLIAENAPEWSARVGPPRIDERLRDRDMGDLAMMTGRQIADRFPAEAARRRDSDEFTYRPPNGESFGDVADRLAAVLADVRRDHAGRRVLMVAHDAVVLMLRRLLERMSWDDLRVVTRAGPVANASITRWVNADGRLVLSGYNVTTHLQRPPDT